MNQDNTIQLISTALDAALMRQTAIANNIANANTKNYKTIEVNFEEQLIGNNQLNFIKPYYIESENKSPIDEQIALNVKNATHYRSLIKGLNHKLAIMKIAIQGNNQS